MPKQRVVRHAVTQPSDPSYRLIALTQGQTAIVDTEDYEHLNQFNWFADWSETTNSFYARRHKRAEDGSYPMVRMSREILGCKSGEDIDVDHKNLNTLDNRRENLRKSTHSQNCCNRKRNCKNTSGFIGVHWIGRLEKWCARIQVNGKRIVLGCFKNKEDAARAYDEAAKKYHGEFATLNLPQAINV